MHIHFSSQQLLRKTDVLNLTIEQRTSMKFFQLDFLYNKKTTLKKKLFLIAFLFCLLNLNAQVTLRIELGVLIENDSDNLGLLLNVEPKVKISKNTIFGLRFGFVTNPQKFKIDDSSQFFINNPDDNGIISFVPTFDYYLNENKYRPYIGLGLGYYFFDSTDVFNQNSSVEVLEGSVNNQLGFLLRGGLELGKTRLGLEYNFIPKADIKIPNGQTIGTVNNSYMGLSIGFTIGGGKSST